MKSSFAPIFAIAFLLLISPFTVSAGSTKLSCELKITTQAGSVTVNDKETILLQKGDVAEIEWSSKNAKKAFDDDGDKIETNGSATTSPKKSKAYTYTFENGRKETECEVVFKVVEASFDVSTLTTMSVKPTIAGEAENLKTVQIRIYKENSKKPFFTSKTIKVKKGKWSTKVTKTLPKGDYMIALSGDKNAELNTIATSTLTIGKKAQVHTTTFVVEPVPLLNGGIAKKGTTVPVAYFQVINIGKNAGKVEGFSIKQNGTASVESIVGFTISDSSSPFVTTILPTPGKPLFKEKTAVLPFDLAIQGGQMKLFTIKAILAPSAIAYGQQLKLDIAAVETDGIEKGTFPVRGTTWTLGY